MTTSHLPASLDVHGAAPSAQAADLTSTNRIDHLLMPLVFVGGFGSIGVELATSRLAAPYFGTSTLVWANLIGLTLAYLAMGYYLGGKIADRYPSTRLLYMLTAVAGFAIGLLPIVAKPILRNSAGAIDNVEIGAFVGSFAGVVLLLAVPMTLLGCVTPFAIRLRMTSLGTAGNTAGNVWALSTVGSIAGSFIPVLLLIPLLGTRWTFFVLGGSILLVSVAGLVENRAIVPAVLAATLTLFLAGYTAMVDASDIKPPYRGTLIEEVESEYHYIQVLDEDGVRLLALNEGHAIHSIYDPVTPLTDGPWDLFLLSPLFLESSDRRIDNALIIGMAGGTTARSLLAAYPSAKVIGVEIDPEITRIGKEYFALDDPRIDVHTGDGRLFLNTSDEQFDLIGIDAYRQPYIPFHLTTVEFFQQVQNHLTTDGVVAVNAGRTDTDYRLVDVLATTMLEVYPQVVLIDTERFDNTLIFGLPEQASIDALIANTQELDAESIISMVALRSLDTGDIRVAISSGDPYTDDHAPVEWLVDRMILDAVREDS